MTEGWHGLLANLGVVAVFVMIWTYLQDRIAILGGWARPLAFGALMGAGAVASMLLPFHFAAGINLDLRGSPVALCGLFGGPAAGAIAAAIAAAYRLYLGGVGAPAGCIGIIVHGLIGVAAHVFVARRTLRASELLTFSAVVACGSLIGISALPEAIRHSVMNQAAEPVTIVTFVATAMAGLAMLLETKRREMANTNALLRSVFVALPDCLNVKDLGGRFIVANPATARLMKAGPADELIGRTDFDFYPREVAERFKADELRVLAGRQPTTIEQTVVRPNEPTIWLSTLKAVLRDTSGDAMGVITLNRDITDRKRLERELERTRQRLADALEHMADALVMFDGDQNLIFCNAQYLAMFSQIADLCVPGVSHRELLRASAERKQQNLGEADLETWLDESCALLRVAQDRLIQLQDGRWLEARTRPTDDGGSLIVYSDVTERKRAEEALADLNRNLALLAATDGLTGLVNRRMFDVGLEREFARARRENTPVSLLLIDVDRFKAFNDTYGHPAGDRCLLAVSQCLSQGLKRPGDLVARYGGEEFAAILPNTTAEGAYNLAEQIRRAVRAQAMPHSGSEKGIVTISAGLAAAPGGQSDLRCADLLRAADKGLYAAKAAGRDCVRTSDADDATTAGAARRLAG